MARPIEVPVVVKKGSLSRSIEGEATAAMHKLGRSSGAVAPLGRMLGKIRADADEFTKSIEASNARVIAFGASVGVINGISNAFKSLIATTVKVEKSMADINIVLGASQSNLAKFGDGLFKVAKNTAQSFDVVAEAATEFARQGLSIEETLKRTNDALILTRLTGLKAAESVKGLTAAVNGFGKAGLTTTQIINKLSAVDVKFAVGTDDLIDALSRAGAVAQDAGVSFDELVALVTVAQQRTARGGAVIGNAFKTIYTRIQDPKALNALREVGIAVDDIAGAALPANRVLQNLASTYDTLNRSQKATIDQFVAGKFQINILKSVLGDLSTVNNEYNRAQQVSANATDQAIQKNQQLNKTLAALATQGGVAIEELAKKVGDISLGPGMRNIITTFNELVEGMTRGLDGESTGATFAKGLLRGVGGILTGPGLVLVGGVFIKLFKDLTVFGVKSLKNLLGLNNASKQQAALQQGIGQLLATNLKFQQAIAAAEGNTAKQAAITSRFLAQEVTMRERAAAATSRMAAGAFAGGFGVSSAGVITRGARRRGAPSFAPTGGIPNFASIKDYIKDGVFNVGQMPEVMTGSTNRYGTRTDNKIPIDAFFQESKLQHTSGKKKGQYTAAGDQLRQVLDAHGVTHIQGHVRAMNLPFSDTKGALSFYDQAFNVGPAREIGIDSDVRTRQTRSLADVGRQMMIDNPKKYGMSPTDAFMDAVRKHRPSILASGMSEYQLRSFYTGSGGSFERAMFAADSNLKPYGHANFMFDAARDIGGGKFRQMDVKSRLNRTQFASLLAKKMRTMDLDQVPLMNIEGDRKLFEGQARKRGTFENIMSKVKGFKFGRFIRNFAPLGDAIQREKMQVGAMMGISPSSVQTRVVQNTALKSPFNPQGFGVISPTVGQHSFADAKRMHRGEDLRTANLPNFSISGGTTPLGMGGSRVTDPGGKGVTSVFIEGLSTKAEKDFGEAVVRGATRSTGAAVDPTMRIYGTPRPGDADFMGPMPRPSRGARFRSGLGALGTGASSLGGAAMGPAFTALMLSEMAQGYVPQPSGLQRFGMSPGQRVEAGRTPTAVSYGGTGAAIGATIGAVVGAPLAGVGAVFGAGIGGTIGAGIGSGVGYFVGGEAGLTAEERAVGIDKMTSARADDMNAASQAQQAILQAGQFLQAGDERQFRQSIKQAEAAINTIANPTLKSRLSRIKANAITSGNFKDAGSAIVDEAQKFESFQSRKIRQEQGRVQFQTLSGLEGKLTTGQKQEALGRFSGMSTSSLTQVREGMAQATTARSEGHKEILLHNAFQRLGFESAKAMEMARGFAANEDGSLDDVIGLLDQAIKSKQEITDALEAANQKGINVFPDFKKISESMKSRAREAEVLSKTFSLDQRAAQLVDDQRIGIQGRRFGTRNTIDLRANLATQAQGRQYGMDRQMMFAQAGANMPTLTANPANLPLMRELDAALQARDAGRISSLVSGLGPTAKGATFQGTGIQIDEKTFTALQDWAKSLDATSEVLDITNTKQLEYIELQRKLAKDLDKGGIVNSAIEGFRTSLKDAMMSIADPSMGGKDIARNLLLGVLGSIQAEASSQFADNFTNMLFGEKQKGGVIKAKNGMYISGNRTGDKNPALLEDGEYVLNKKMVDHVGVENLNAMNFDMFPRFGASKSNVMMAQSGGLSLSGGSHYGLLGSLGDMSQYSLKPFEMETGMLAPPGLAYKSLATSADLMELAPLPLPSIASMEAGRANPSQLKITGTSKLPGQGRKVHMTEIGEGGALKMYTFQKRGGQWREIGPGGKLSHKSGIKVWNFSVSNGQPTGLRMSRGTTAESEAGFPGFSASNSKMLMGGLGKILAAGYQDGGGVFGGVPSKHRKRAMVRFGYGSMIPGYQGGTLGGGGVGPRLDIFDARLSSRAHASDPTSQAIRGYFRQQRQKDIQKRFERQAKRDQLTQTVVGTAISAGLTDATQGFSGIKGIFSKLKGGAGGGDGGDGGDQVQQDVVGSHGMPAYAIGMHGGERGQYRTLSDIGGGGGGGGSLGGSLSAAYRALVNVGNQVVAGAASGQQRTEAIKQAVTGNLAAGKKGVTNFLGRGGPGLDAIEFLHQESSRTLERIDRALKELEEMSEGRKTERKLRQFMDRSGFQRGGSIDNIPAMLTGGEFVVNAGAVKRYGSNTLQHMNRGGMVGNQKFVPGDQNGSAKSNGEAGTSNTNNTVSISVNMGANGSPSISEDASGSTQDSARGARDLGRKIRDAVRAVIDEEKRLGGSLRNPYAREQ